MRTNSKSEFNTSRQNKIQLVILIVIYSVHYTFLD